VVVVDASVFVDAVAFEGEAGAAARTELNSLQAFAVPDVFRAEVVSALRSLVLAGRLDFGRSEQALRQLREISVDLFPFEPYLRRVWELRENLSVYDAWYVALAEGLETVLITADSRLANAPGPRCLVRLIRA
jgi:predicted nucleic acid-binding protein